MRRHRITRLIVGAVVPVPIAMAVTTIAFGLADRGRSVAVTVWNHFLFYLALLPLGFYMMGLQCLVYSAVMELLGSRGPVVRKNVILFICFSAVTLSVCAFLPTLDFDGMILSLAAFTGAVTGLVLWLLRRRKGQAPSPFEPAIEPTSQVSHRSR